MEQISAIHKAKPGGLYIPPSWQTLKQQCLHLAQFGGGIQVIHGEKGAGKSTLFQLLQEESVSPDFLALTAPEAFNAEEFLVDLSWQLGLRPENDASFGELLAGLRSYVQSLQQEAARVVVAIDDAHFIADAPLGALVSVLQGRNEPGLGMHFMFFAEPGLAQRLDALQLLDIEIHDSIIPSFSISETEQFLYAQGVGLEQPPSAEMVRRVRNQSRGLPGPILALLAESVTEEKPIQVKEDSPTPRAAEPKKDTLMKSLPLAHIAALIVLFSFLIWAFLMRPAPDETASGTLPNETATSSVTPLADDEGLTRLPIIRSESPSEIPEQSRQANLDDAPAPSNTALPSDSATATTFESEMSQQEDVPVVESTVDDAHQSDQLVEQTDSPTVADESKTGLETESSANPIPATAEKQNAASVEQNQKSSAARPANAEKNYSQDEVKLTGYLGDAYVLQIMASSDKMNLQSFVEKQPNDDNLLIYQTKKNGKELFILVEGFYADKQSATAAIDNLPTAQKRGGPWPKQLAQVHKEIDSGRSR